MTEKLQQLLSSTPWSRMVHWFGRATDFPQQVEMLLENRNEEAIHSDIARNVEHQDGVFQASPYMVQVLIELLKEPNTNKKEILDILHKVYKAVKFQIDEGSKPNEEEAPLEDELWPEFEDEDTDEMLWEEFKSANFYYWQKHCYSAICEAKELIESFSSSSSGKVKEAAEHFFS